jgi:cytochrome b
MLIPTNVLIGKVALFRDFVFQLHMLRDFIKGIIRTKANVKQSHYRPGHALSFAGG